MQRKKVIIFVFAIAVLLTAVIWRTALSQSEYLTVHVLDVGQGDATFIELPGGQQILVDGGPDASVLDELSSIMGPLDRTIDVVIATHADADHIGGLPDVLKRYEISTIIDSGLVKDTELFRAWSDSVVEEGAEVIFADSIKRLRFSDFAVIDILWPQKPVIGEESLDANEYSIVARLTYGEVDILLTGDIERWAEQQIVNSGVMSEVEIMKVPHHGAKTSTTASLLNAASPELALISVGSENRYGHPHESTLRRVSEHGANIFRTDLVGRITIQSDGLKYWIE